MIKLNFVLWYTIPTYKDNILDIFIWTKTDIDLNIILKKMLVAKETNKF